MCTRQINYCSSLVKKLKEQFYGNLNIKHVTDNNKFWEAMKPLCSIKTKLLNIMILLAYNFLSPILVSDWLIFCCGNLILNQKRNENNNMQFFDEKQKNVKKVYINIK